MITAATPRVDRATRRTARKRTPIDSLPYRVLKNRFPPVEMLNQEQIDKIHNASMRILEEIGIDFVEPESLSLWEKAGARVDHKAQHVWIDRALLMSLVSKAPSEFTLRARDPLKNVTVGGNNTVFVSTSGTPFVSDYDKGRRDGSIADVQNLVKLIHMCPPINVVESQVTEPQDLPVTHRHLARGHAIFTLSDKPIAQAAHGTMVCNDCLNMAAIVFGGHDEIRKQPVFASIINANSPLRYDTSMAQGLITYSRGGQPLVVTPFILAGAMSPITMAAAVAQQNAEALAGIALTQICNPGVPVIYGGFTTNIDLATGGPAFGTPEGAWAFFAGAQLARRYGLPYRGSGGLNTSKLVDAQAAYETQMCLWPVVMSHTNWVQHGAGWLEGGLVCSFEKFIIDVEGIAMMHHLFEPDEISDATLALDMMAEIGPGGHHFGTSHTLGRYQTEFYKSAVADRLNIGQWEENGKLDAGQRAHKIWKELLNNYEPPPIDPAVKEELTAYVERRMRELK
ncbi:MAG: trimethylamine methyltransferase family protein [Chloroflexota bacterium]